MRRFSVIAAVFVALVAAAAAHADSFTVVRTSVGFPSNDSVSWATLGSGLKVPDGSSVASSTGFTTATLTFGLLPTPGHAGGSNCEAPGSGCTWNGNFAAMANLLTNISPRNSHGQGAIDLTFSQGITNVGFDIQPKDLGTFKYVVEALDGSTVLGTFSVKACQT